MPNRRQGDSSSEEDLLDDGESEKLAELERLQRQFRVLNEQRDRYFHESQNLMKQQTKEIELLTKERSELRTNLSLTDCPRNDRRDGENTRKLRRLLLEKENAEDEILAEKELHECLDEKIEKADEDIKARRQCLDDTVRRRRLGMLKKLTTTENRLDQALKTFNSRLTHNNRLKEEIADLRIAKQNFESVHSKMTKQLKRLREKIMDVTTIANHYYDQKSDFNTKQNQLFDRAESDEEHDRITYNELLRNVEKDRLLHDFMSTKRKLLVKDEQMMKWRRRTLAHARQHHVDMTESLDDYEKIEERLKEISGLDDFDKIVEDFITKERNNYSEFIYIATRNHDAELIETEISYIRHQIEELRSEEVHMEDAHKTMLEDLERRCQLVIDEAQNLDTKNNKVDAMIEKLIAAIQRLNNTLPGKKQVQTSHLGFQENVCVDNVLEHIGCIEMRANELVLMVKFLEAKAAEEQKKRREQREREGVYSDSNLSLLAAETAAETVVKVNVESLVPAMQGDEDFEGLTELDLPLSRQEMAELVLPWVIRIEEDAIDQCKDQCDSVDRQMSFIKRRTDGLLKDSSSKGKRK